MNTVNSYISDIRDFFNFNSEGDINGYLKKLYDNKIKISSLNRKLSSLSGYYDFLYRNKYINTNICINVERPKMEKKLPVYLTYGEVERLINGIKDDELLERAIIEMIYGCRLRASGILDRNILIYKY